MPSCSTWCRRPPISGVDPRFHNDDQIEVRIDRLCLAATRPSYVSTPGFTATTCIGTERLVPAADFTEICVVDPGARFNGACTIASLSAAKKTGAAMPSNMTEVPDRLVGKAVVASARTPPAGPRFTPRAQPDHRGLPCRS